MNFSPDSKLMRQCEKLTAYVRINLLWLLCSLPVFTIGASGCAMFSMLSALRAEEETGCRAFFAAFRRHFKRATALWLATLFLGVMLALDYRIVAYLEFPGRMTVICVICFCFLALLLVSGVSFPLLACCPDTLRGTVVNAVLLTLANLPKALLILSAQALPVLLVIVAPRLFVFISFLFPVCGFSLIGRYQLSVAEKIFAAALDRE